MIIKKVSICVALGLSVLSACSKSESQSKLDGHPEYLNDKYTAQTSKDGILVKPIAAPEYAPTESVIISLTVLTSTAQHKMAKALLDSEISKLYVLVPGVYPYKTAEESPDFGPLRLLGADLKKIVLVPAIDSAQTQANLQKGEKYLTVWARDWSPQSAYTQDGQLVLLDFNYYSNRDADDSAARSLVNFLNIGIPDLTPVTDPSVVSRISVPVYNEGGNFMNNDSGDCLMSTRVTDANNAQAIAVAAADNRRKKITADEVMDKTEIIRQYKEKAGCKTVSIFPRIPYEGTGHIDMWAKFLDNETIIVNEIRQEIVNLEWYTAEERAKVLEIQNYLEARTKDIKALGFKVVRIPMPAPVFGYLAYLDEAKTQVIEYPDVFRSYTNSITVNSHAVTPRYEAIDGTGAVYSASTDEYLGSLAIKEPYPDAALIPSYEAEAQGIYESLGYKMNYVTVDNLISIGGAIHCTTMQIAKNPNVI